MIWYDKKPGKWQYLPPEKGERESACWTRDCVFFWMDLERAGRKRWTLTISAPGGAPFHQFGFEARTLNDAQMRANVEARVALNGAYRALC